MINNSQEHSLKGGTSIIPKPVENELIGFIDNVTRFQLMCILKDSYNKEVRELSPEQEHALLSMLKVRFAESPLLFKRPQGVNFTEVQTALKANPSVMWSLAQMEKTFGEPDVIAIENDSFIFGDRSDESPRRNCTHDQATKMSQEFGIDLMSREHYLTVQALRHELIDMHSMTQLATPVETRKLGQVLYGYNCSHTGDVFVIEHNDDSPISYDNVGWRGVLRAPKA